jgi:hypothetical protein
MQESGLLRYTTLTVGRRGKSLYTLLKHHHVHILYTSFSYLRIQSAELWQEPSTFSHRLFLEPVSGTLTNL